jgi:hypothetical protein
MAERKMSGKALLVEAEMSAADLRRLTDDFLGKPTELTAPPAAVKARSASRAKILRSSLAVIFSVALAGIAVGALRESDKRAALPPPPPAVIPVAEPPPSVQPAELAPPESVVLVNPFDKTETFTFPPGTSKADARDQMATLLLQRAVERRAHLPRSRKLAAEPRASSTGHGS